MPRIRKKTSNRVKTRDRAKINKKVAEHKKKSKRDVKRNPQWKSKKKADPGVPNSFHLKDQVLAEMAEEKRIAEEAKLAAKEAARRKRKEDDEEDEDDVAAPGVISFGNTVLDRAPLSGVSELVTDEDDSDVPDLLDSDLPTLQAALDAADVFLEVVDARDIQGGRSGHVESLVTEADGTVLLVINKADLVPREALEAWLKVLPFRAYIVSARDGTGVDELVAALNALAKKKGGDEPLKAALLGLPNVGKSSVANALLGAPKFKVAPELALNASAKHPMPTTPAPAEAEIASGVRIIDTPGWEYVEEEDSDEEDEDENDDDEKMDEDSEDEEAVEASEAKLDALEARVAGDLLRRNLGRVDRVKDVFPLVNYIFVRSNPQDLMLKYNVPYFTEGDLEAFLTGLARVNNRVKKHGNPDVEGAARIVLRDWATNAFPYYSTAPKGLEGGKAQPDNSAALAALRSRKEMKATGPLIRFKPSELDMREIFLDDDYTAMSPEGSDDEDDEGALAGFTDADFAEFDGLEEGDEDEDDEDESGEEDEGLYIGSGDDEEVELESGPEPSSPSSLDEEDEEEEESEEEEAPAPPSRKRKAVSSPVVVRKKAKTVSFKAKPEPKSQQREVKEVKSILKKAPSTETAPEPRPVKKAKVATKAESKPSKPATNGKAAKKAKVAPTASSKASAAAAASGLEAYDFSKHF